MEQLWKANFKIDGIFFFALILSPFKLQQREEEEEKDNFKAKHSTLKIKHNELNIDLSDYYNHFCLPPSICPFIILPSLFKERVRYRK